VFLVSALKHGFFRAGFMLCDRCAWNGECKRFRAGGECWFEKRAFKKITSRMVEEFELDCFVDKILVERVAMYLVRIARAEAYETAVGVSDKSVLWGGYISRLDNTLRGLLNDLAVSRVKRKQLEKNEALLVSVDELMKKFAKAEAGSRRERRARKRRATVSPRRALLSSWRSDYKKLCLTVRRDEDIG